MMTTDKQYLARKAARDTRLAEPRGRIKTRELQREEVRAEFASLGGV